MALYLISYDLIRPEKDYEDLINGLERAGAVRVLFSQWLLRTNRSKKEVYDYVRSQGMDGNDKLLVVAVSEWIASANMQLNEKGF